MGNIQIVVLYTELYFNLLVGIKMNFVLHHVCLIISVCSVTMKYQKGFQGRIWTISLNNSFTFYDEGFFF